MMHSLPDGYRAIVLGASGAIGGAFVRGLRADPRCAEVIGLHRGSEPRIELDDEPTLAAASAALRARSPFHLIVNATGALHLPDADRRPTLPPEKRLADLDPHVLASALRINAIGPALLIKHFHDLLPVRDRGLFASLSARVGSIGDNHKGGWYAYRASKAAQNMLLRTAAIEIARRRPAAVVVALHPGTVRSPLSERVVGGAEALDPDVSVARLLAVLDRLEPEATGSFWAHDGAQVPW